MKALRGRARVAAALAAVIAAASCAAPTASCAPESGGEPGSLVQLRRISFGDDQLSLLFVQRSGAQYGVPEHTVERAGDVVRVRLPGARLRTADGFSSYRGDDVTAPPPGAIRSVEMTEEASGAVVVELRVSGGGCPRLLSRRFGLGTTFSAALVSVALRGGPVVALDPDRGAPGSGMQVIGLGFAPSTPVVFTVGRDVWWSSRSDERGYLDTVLFVPDLPRGQHRNALVRDGSGSALAWFRVN